MPSESVPMREFFIRAVLDFVHGAARVDGVCSLALLGSLTTPKQRPKDADILVRVKETVQWKPLAKIARGLKGHAQSRNAGADIFIASVRNRYRGRICRFRDCRPGVRVSCDALHCGRTPYLCDDLQILTLSKELLRAPPIELWPKAYARIPVPSDIEALIETLESEASSRY